MIFSEIKQPTKTNCSNLSVDIANGYDDYANERTFKNRSIFGENVDKSIVYLFFESWCISLLHTYTHDMYYINSSIRFIRYVRLHTV